jgi:hypothetical protein
MASTEVDLIWQLRRTLQRVWLALGAGSALPVGKGVELKHEVDAALQAADDYLTNEDEKEG